MCIKDFTFGLAVGMIAGAVIYSYSAKSRGIIAKSKKVISQKLKDIADSM